MTRDQLDYWALQETKAHNRATEQLGSDTLVETRTHNRATEGYQLGSLAESSRHNVATENYQLGSLAETKRHNVASEEANIYSANMSYRSRVDSAQISAATNEYIAQMNAALKQIDQSIAHQNADTQRYAMENQSQLIASQIEDLQHAMDLKDSQAAKNYAEQIVANYEALLKKVQYKKTDAEASRARTEADIASSTKNTQKLSKQLEVITQGQKIGSQMYDSLTKPIETGTKLLNQLKKLL